MAQLMDIWDEIYCQLTNYNSVQINELQAIIFSSLGKYDIEEKNQETNLTVYDDDKKGYMMFFVAKRVEGLSDKSLVYYKHIIDLFLKKTPKSLKQIKTDDIRYYLAIRQARDKASAVTLDNERRILNVFFDWLSMENYVEKNICKPIKKVKTPKKKKKAFTDVEIQRIKDACSQLNTQLERKKAIAIVEFLLSTGCRVGEVSILKKADIDLDSRTAIVFGKGSKERTVYLNQVTKMRLLEYWDLKGDAGDYAFAPERNISTAYMSICSIEKLVKKLGEVANVDNCHPHRFRRTCATTAIKKGMTLLEVQRMLGHESSDTTRMYLDLDDTDLRYQHEKYL